jgi:lysophospholipase L1-like esterase
MINSQPDIVLLHIGTNDRTTTNPEGVNQILNEIDMYEQNSGKHVQVYVALIIDRQEHDGRIPIFNQRLNDLLQQRISQGDDIVIVDMYNGAGLTSSDYADNTHPNNNGYYKMANVWFNAIMQNYNINPNLRSFPTSLVPQEYIIQVDYDDDGNTVSFLTNIPDNGIQF